MIESGRAFLEKQRNTEHLDKIRALMEEARKTGVVCSTSSPIEYLVPSLSKEFIEAMEENYQNSKIIKKMEDYSEVMDLT